jgi:hypothetical protein
LIRMCIQNTTRCKAPKNINMSLKKEMYAWNGGGAYGYMVVWGCETCWMLISQEAVGYLFCWVLPTTAAPRKGSTCYDSADWIVIFTAAIPHSANVIKWSLLICFKQPTYFSFKLSDSHMWFFWPIFNISTWVLTLAQGFSNKITILLVALLHEGIWLVYQIL